jgi:hypothetical protein
MRKGTAQPAKPAPAPADKPDDEQGHWKLSSRQNLNAEVQAVLAARAIDATCPVCCAASVFGVQARMHIENSEELFKASLEAKNMEALPAHLRCASSGVA